MLSSSKNGSVGDKSKGPECAGDAIEVRRSERAILSSVALESTDKLSFQLMREDRVSCHEEK